MGGPLGRIADLSLCFNFSRGLKPYALAVFCCNRIGATQSPPPLADFVVTTIPHTPESEGMFDARVFGLMKRSAIFINIGRGMTTRLDDLNAALRGGVIAGAGLDVYEIEPLPTSHPLWDAPNTLLTPHTAVKGGAHLDERRYAIIENNVRRFLEGAPLVNVVDKAQWF